MPVRRTSCLSQNAVCARPADGIFFRFERSSTFWRFGEWKAVFRRTVGYAKPPLFRPL
jgi:hypothetical protein